MYFKRNLDPNSRMASAATWWPLSAVPSDVLPGLGVFGMKHQGNIPKPFG
jgi:hypothetical protein